MLKPLFISVVFIFITGILSSQNLIGLHVNDIRKEMVKLRPNFKVDNTTVNAKSLKYIDKNGDNTLAFFYNEKGVCTYQKFMMEVDFAKNTVDTLTKKYKYVDKLTWLDTKDGKDYLIKMENSQYYFTVIYSLKED